MSTIVDLAGAYERRGPVFNSLIYYAREEGRGRAPRSLGGTCDAVEPTEARFVGSADKTLV
jgi:hypothetical protein